MKVILVDDEKSTLMIMEKMLSQIPQVELTGVFQNTREAYRFIKQHKVDMAFVDISMPEENGLEFAGRIASEFSGIDIVFLTAYKEFALEAFDLYALDYIVKPVFQERLERTVRRALQKRVPILSNGIAENPARLSVYCLGGLNVISAGGEVVKWTSSKSAELLAYLLMYRGKFVSKWSVMEAVFRGMPPHNAETYLNTSVYKLRKALEPYGMRAAVVSVNESYRIEMNGLYVDFMDFEDRVSSLTEITASNQEDALKAERLYTGELFGDKGYHWSLPEREKLSDIYESLGKKLAGYLLASREFAQALQVLKKLALRNGLDEDINCLFMRIYAAQKDKRSLTRQYERYVKALQKELGVAPGSTLDSFYTELLSSLE